MLLWPMLTTIAQNDADNLADNVGHAAIIADSQSTSPEDQTIPPWLHKRNDQLETLVTEMFDKLVRALT